MDGGRSADQLSTGGFVKLCGRDPNFGCSLIKNLPLPRENRMNQEELVRILRIRNLKETEGT